MSAFRGLVKMMQVEALYHLCNGRPGMDQAAAVRAPAPRRRPPSRYPDKKLEAGETVENVFVAGGDDVLSLQDTDPVLNMKMRLVNDAIDELGWTGYHAKLFFLNGFGYAVDSMILNFQSIVSEQAYRELGHGGYRNALTIAVYCGMLSGAVFWGSFADIIGRKIAFNLTLFMCAACCTIAGAMPNWPSLGFFIALLGFGGGGNLILDSVVFLEYLPSSKQWLLTALACWWGFGQAIASAIGWCFLVPERWNCEAGDSCSQSNNWGWRFTLFTGGGLVLALSLLRITVIRLRETPKYQLSVGKDAELVETFHFLAHKYNRPCSLTLEKLEACGSIQSVGRRDRFFLAEALSHVRGLFSTRKLAISTTMLWTSWAIIGLAYALFFVFLPTYLRNSGVEFQRPKSETWRNLVITDLSGVPGPILAGFLCNLRLLGRRYTMTIGALCTAAFFFAYPMVKTATQDLIVNSFIAFFIHVYYGTLYAYTPEVLPSAHRATGNGIAVACNRIMGILSAVIATVADTSTPAPLYTCGGLLITAGVVAVMFPLEPCNRRSS